MKTRREKIINVLDDHLSKLIYYDRKEDEELGVGDIERAIIAGEITVNELIELFRLGLETAVAQEKAGG